MSFFGFDTNGPPNGEQEAVDFENTYDGYGEELNEADDKYNDETFGNTGPIGKDFNYQQPQSQNISYAQAATINDDDFMRDLWGKSNPLSAELTSTNVAAPEKKILSLEEIEAQLTSIDNQQQQPVPMQLPQQQFGMPGMIPQQPFGMPGMMPPMYGQYPGMPGFGQPFYQMPPHLQGPVPQQVPQQIPPQVQGQVPQQVQPQVQGQLHPQVVSQGNLSPQEPAPVQVQPQVQPQVQSPVSQISQAVPQQSQQTGAVSSPQPSGTPVHAENAKSPAVPLSEIISPSSKDEIARIALKSSLKSVNVDQFPVLGAKYSHSGYQKHSNLHRHRNDGHEPLVLTPEQQAKAARRHEKVSRIMRYSGIMNPKDKDFVTRFQLSQIVTEDPYNEDFYAQVFKVIHPKPDQIGQLPDQQNNSIAQAYLDQSGHRLGGREKRADVALQRMQQQVQRAVTVAKERPKLTKFVREGALGRISVGTGKRPRQQLEIFSEAVQKGLAEEDNEEEQANKGLHVAKFSAPLRSVSSSDNGDIIKYSKKDIMGILENIITNLMQIESDSRISNDVDTNKLWDSLRILEQTSPKVSDSSEVNPFIQCLNREKALKIITRLFKYLNREQILTIATLLMSNLSNLDVVKYGSYTIYDDKKVPPKYQKLIETYSLTFTKVLMNSVQEFKFNEIIGLLVILIEHNNLSLVSTTKIGLSVLTTLLSRAELIRGEGTISSSDLNEWSSCYDELFTSLETRISLIFPPNDDNESYVWQFLATMALGGKLNHQRIIVDEVRDAIFSVMNKAKALDSSDINNYYIKQNLLNNLNIFLVVMGLVADEHEIREL